MSTVAEVIGEVNLNLAMVEDGQAFAYRQYLSQCNARLLSQGHTYLGTPEKGRSPAAQLVSVIERR